MSFKVIGTSAMTIRGVFRSSVVGVRLESKYASGFSDLVEEIIFSKIKLMSRECKTDWLNLWNPSKVVFFFLHWWTTCLQHDSFQTLAWENMNMCLSNPCNNVFRTENVAYKYTEKWSMKHNSNILFFSEKKLKIQCNYP